MPIPCVLYRLTRDEVVALIYVKMHLYDCGQHAAVWLYPVLKTAAKTANSARLPGSSM